MMSIGTESNALFNKRLEIVTTIILAVASLLTAWGGYEAAQWGSIQAISLSEASGKRTRAAQVASLGGQDRLQDVVTFGSWVEAMGVEDQERADFIRARFRSEFKPAFAAWLALKPLENPDAPSSPFAMPEYTLAREKQAADIEAEASALFEKGSRASDVSSLYVRASLFVAASLFFAALSKTLENRAPRMITLGLSAALLLLGALSLAPLPIA